MDINTLNKELRFRFSRSSGSGGQHVNKVETRVELLFDIDQSTGLTDNEKALLLEKLQSRINTDGILLIAAQQKRSQLLNKREANRRFFKLLEEALAPAPNRKGPPKLTANKQERLKQKKQNSEKKAMRKKVTPSPSDF